MFTYVNALYICVYSIHTHIILILCCITFQGAMIDPFAATDDAFTELDRKASRHSNHGGITSTQTDTALFASNTISRTSTQANKSKDNGENGSESASSSDGSDSERE